MENHYNCIYMYTNKINGKRYVGQTVDFNKRHRAHINAMTNKKNKDYNQPIHRALRKYGLDNFDVEILKENLNTQCLLNFYECYYIKKFDLLCKNGKGYNVSEGGSNGNSFAGQVEEEKKERCKKISDAAKGRKHSEETKEKLHELFFGENSPRAKKINQYDINGNFIKTWNCQSDICRYYNVSNSCITQAISRGNYYSLGFIWLEQDKKITPQIIENAQKKSNGFKGENNPMYGKHHSELTKQKISEMMSSENNPRAKRVAQYDKQRKLIKVWDYIKQASEELGINRESISACCRGKQKTAGGYIWRYAEETE